MVTKMDMEQVHQNLTKKIEEYIAIILNEYGSYIPKNVLEKLNNITDYSQILKIYDYGEISAYADDNNIMMPLCAEKMLGTVKKIPGYGIYKNHKTYTNENVIINNNTFLTYISHVFISGTSAEGYYDDLLLHETMHFCGGDGASVLKEGINELLTRKLAKKYSLRTNSCGYPKEVQLSYKLMKLFGEDVITKIAFMKDFNYEVSFIRDKLGEDAARLYYEVFSLAEKEFQDKYYSHMNEFKGISGIIKKVLMYKQIDYSPIYELIIKYEKNLAVSTSKKF